MAGISEKNKQYLVKLHRYSNGIIDLTDAARILRFDRHEASKFMSYLSKQGWARRIRRGLYILIPLEVTSPKDWSEDSWVIADRLFGPSYIAGWTACEFWGFTDQIFRDICVFTASNIRGREINIDNTKYILRKVAKDRFFGLHVTWRNDVRIQVSDATKTIIDILDPPLWGGGIRHVFEIISMYIGSQHRNDTMIIDYLRHLGRGSVVKRLGYILEIIDGENSSLYNELQDFITSGYILLDPSLPPRGPYLARWRIRVNAEVG
jgi:predicted transcriptional regulator of viral defense system